MRLSQDEQYRRAEIIIDAICKIAGISYCDFIWQKKSLIMNIARGIAFYLSWEYGIHAKIMAVLTKRSRCNVINQSRRYRNYIHSKDAVSLKMYTSAKKIIEEKLL